MYEELFRDPTSQVISDDQDLKFTLLLIIQIHALIIGNQEDPPRKSQESFRTLSPGT
jgi:hypothetical protein